MALTTTSRSKLKQFIERVARKINAKYSSRYQGIDDYIQIGNIALWQVEQQLGNKDCEMFIPYACAVIIRNIRHAAIESTGAVSGSYRAKVQAIRAQAALANGHSEEEIRNKLQVITKWKNDEEWIALRGMIMHVFGDKALAYVADKSCSDYSIFDDMLNISSLTSDEKQAMQKATGKTNRWDKSCPALSRAKDRVRKKLIKGGY